MQGLRAMFADRARRAALGEPEDEMASNAAILRTLGVAPPAPPPTSLRALLTGRTGQAASGASLSGAWGARGAPDDEAGPSQAIPLAAGVPLPAPAPMGLRAFMTGRTGQAPFGTDAIASNPWQAPGMSDGEAGPSEAVLPAIGGAPRAPGSAGLGALPTRASPQEMSGALGPAQLENVARVQLPDVSAGRPAPRGQAAAPQLRTARTRAAQGSATTSDRAARRSLSEPDPVQQAAERLAANIRNAPTYKEHEWGGFIYQSPGGQVEYSPAMTSEQVDRVDLLPSKLVPKGARVLGWVHSHLPNNINQADLSEVDRETARTLKRRGLPNRTVDPKLRTYILDQKTGRLILPK